MIATYHNHTRYSDGKPTLVEIGRAAAEQGIDELGVSDHLTLAPWGSVPWSMDPAKLDDYVDELLSMRDRAKLSLRLGLEVDWFKGHGETIARMLHGKPFDYLIGSVHFVGEFGIDASAVGWQALDEEGLVAAHRGYWRLIRELAESNLFQVVGHLDLTKKFGNFLPAVSLEPEIDAALDAIAGSGSVVELNTAGWHKPCRDAYPTSGLLARCRERDIGVTLSSDAHHPDDLVRDFERGAQRLRRVGYDRIARFAGGEISFKPL